MKEKKFQWGKKKTIQVPVAVVGTTDAKVCLAPRECDSVAIIRNAQEELKNVKELDVDDIVKEFFVTPFDMRDDYHYRSFMMSHLGDIRYAVRELLSKLEMQKKMDYEEYFRKFGKQIQRYVDRHEEVQKLNDTIAEHKKRLGIE